MPRKSHGARAIAPIAKLRSRFLPSIVRSTSARLIRNSQLNHPVKSESIVEGVLAVECVELLRAFFEERR